MSAEWRFKSFRAGRRPGFVTGCAVGSAFSPFPSLMALLKRLPDSPVSSSQMNPSLDQAPSVPDRAIVLSAPGGIDRGGVVAECFTDPQVRKPVPESYIEQTAEPGCISIAWRETRCQHPPARSKRWSGRLRAGSFRKCASDAASPARTEALKKAGLLRHQAELRSLVIEGARKTDACHPQAMMLGG
ncbi:MAG: hypothetical protein JWP25_7251 [Bradyrhizobium sp.]|nr:hypothetical protein [Bradyrhizobium sp.]